MQDDRSPQKPASTQEHLRKTEARIDVAGIQIEICDFEWPRPVETRVHSDKHQFSFSLTPRPQHTRIRYETGKPDESFTDAGDLIFFPASIPFVARSDGGRQRLLSCAFESRYFDGLRRRRPDWSDAELAAGLDIRDAKVRASLARVAQEAMSPGFASAMLMESLLKTALIDLARYFERHGDRDELPRGGLAPWQMRRVRERVADPDAPAPSIDELARLCGISPRHLMRGFKQLTATTLHSYVDEVRLGRAKSLLLDTDLPLKTISWKLGFAHASSFSSAFQRALGITPTAFRAQSKRGGEAGL